MDLAKRQWTHYLTRPFNLFGASLWQQWYVDPFLEKVANVQMKNSLSIEQSAGITRNYRDAHEFAVFKDGLRQLVVGQEARAFELLKEAEKCNDRGQEYIAGTMVFLNLADAIAFWVDLGVLATVLPYWVVYFSETTRYQNAALLPLAEKLRSISLYPDFFAKVITPLAARELERAGKDPALVGLLTYVEIVNHDFSALKERQQAAAAGEQFVYEAAGIKEKITYGTHADEVLVQLEPTTKVKEVRGQVAYPGIVRGIARLVFGISKNAVFNVGDILVSINSNPSLMPLIKKCGGIITDEGGITCHAAIIARELKIPCVIGTKVATQVIKDGDEVEIDGHHGTINIIHS